MITPSKLNHTSAVAILASACIAIFISPALSADTLDSILLAQAETDTAAQASQERIDALYDGELEDANKYRQALADAESFKKFIANQQQQVGAQRKELQSIQQQLSEIERTQREVEPLMQRMLATLEEFIALDVPFLIDERTNRVNKLKEMMERVDVTVSEKYRRILEAYQIEMEFGRTLDFYEGEMGEGDSARTVNFVRLGRVSLMYQTLDGLETGYWDVSQKAFVRDDSYADRVKNALRVAKKSGAPDLIIVPVPAPTEVQS